ncbi:dolichyl-phosphate beta-glucosyltransferase isoform X2 [Oncorhynchus keta]|uniref:dolichyl-phosphate beta-glucosyltransferase isoform X2 n=1 Tax=Oncorhynchus keta TaxID=8018 RepID=UPI00227AE7C2|nr:dolichyl-phosphate beta-glucosyltransferase isoform X2 [Oncorhynchus keta]
MDCLCEIIHCLVGLAVAALIVVLLVAHLTAGMVDLKRHAKETLFPTATGEKEPFPSLHDPSSLELSVIVPAYNEELRMPVMMEEAMGYLENRQKQQPLFTYEVIVVDDGSSDQTTEVALRYTRTCIGKIVKCTYWRCPSQVALRYTRTCIGKIVKCTYWRCPSQVALRYTRTCIGKIVKCTYWRCPSQVALRYTRTCIGKIVKCTYWRCPSQVALRYTRTCIGKIVKCTYWRCPSQVALRYTRTCIGKIVKCTYWSCLPRLPCGTPGHV